MANEKLVCAGKQNKALGIDAKVMANGKCHHPNKREVRREFLDGLPISENNWTHCIFCRGGDCVYAGDCEHRGEYEDGK